MRLSLLSPHGIAWREIVRQQEPDRVLYSRCCSRIYSSYLNGEVQSFCFGESVVDTKSCYTSSLWKTLSITLTTN